VVVAATDLHRRLITWYDAHERELPWRRPDVSAWGVLVSEVMAQQTPVDRVAPLWIAWMDRWPEPRDVAASSPADVLRAWGRLGYPRRALRLQAAATAITERHGGIVPATDHELRALPGVGEYTAAAVIAFAYAGRAVVLDTNVRRVLARLIGGQEHPPPTLAGPERRRAFEVLPADAAESARWNVALMELGATVCTARNPKCEVCPVRPDCAWVAAGKPAYAGPPRRRQSFTGTDRQVRGLIMAVLRDSQHPVARRTIDVVWPRAVQRNRALDGLVADGLVEPLPDDHFALPTTATTN
jgi:A/G-specific adenine glycosylase